jgi:outer membrane cobalamin receptor
MRTNIRAGLRANYFTSFNRVRVEPRISFHQQLNQALTLEVLGEMKSQTTTQIIDYQNDFLGVEKRRWVMANNDDIPMISSQQLSVGFHFQKKDILISLEGYGKWVDHILTSSQGFQNQFQYVRSAGSYHTRGLDFLLNHRFSKVNSWLSYSFAQSTYSFPELIPSTFPNNLDIRHRATGGVGYQSNHLDISCGINWRSGKPYTKPLDTGNDNGFIAYQDPNTARLDNYWRLDISANYKITLSPRVRGLIGISIWNLLDKENIIDAYYQTNATDEIILSQRKALGFTPNVMFRIEF